MNLLPSKLLWRRARTAAHLRPIAGLSSSAPDHIPDLRELTTGLQFPVDPSGSRSTTHAGKSLLSAALRGGGTPEGDALAARVEAEDNWRFRYPEHFLALVRYAASSPDLNLKVSRAGLNFVHDHFQFVDDRGTMSKFSEHMNSFKSLESFNSVRIEGRAAKGGLPVQISYGGEQLVGDKFRAQLAEWADYGCIEPDVAASLEAISTKNLDLQGKHYVLIGAGSAIGPLQTLLRHGATVVCVDLPGVWGPGPSSAWQRIIDIARDSSGAVIIPTAMGAEVSDDGTLIQAAGCNLLEQPGHILKWLSTIAETEQLTVGNYAYLDGELFVKLTVCADAIIDALCRQRPDTSVAFLGSPTDIHVVPEEAFQASRKNYLRHDGRGLEKGVNHLSKGKYFVSNEIPPVYDGDARPIRLVDGITTLQGPNYLIAKRIQHWRSMVEFDAGHTVSSNVAPATRTRSVVSNQAFSWAFGGLPYFKPHVVFDEDTCSTLMADLLISNTTSELSPSNPKNREVYDIRNGLEMFKYNSAHGGLWRCFYRNDSIQTPAVVVNFVGGPKHFWLIARLSVSTVMTAGYCLVLKTFGLL